MNNSPTLSECKEGFSVQSNTDTSAGTETNVNEKTHSCKHYKRRCSFISPCCQKPFPCRLCHDDEVLTHKLDRRAVEILLCSICNHKQAVSNKCSSCGALFGKYFCSICRLFDDNEKGQFHCDKCGICRVGGRENFLHCETCGLCLGKDMFNSHKCVQESSKSNCPICMDDIHTSRDPAHVPKCGHLMHTKCFKAFLKNGHYSCPLCGSSMMDMTSCWEKLDEEVENSPMPEEYANMTKWILCKDCHKVSGTKFHIFGMKCNDCGSYNTCDTEEPPKDEGTPV